MPDPKTVVANYLAHLARHRLPAQMPTNRAEFETLLANRNAQHAAESDQEWEHWNEFDRAIRRDPEAGWLLLLDAIEQCDPADLVLIGTGELESFFFSNADAFAKRFEEQLRTNQKFFNAFRSAHMGGVPERIWRHFNSVLAELGVPSDELVEWTWVDVEQYPDG